MEKISVQTFDNGNLKIWFFVDNIRFYDKNKDLIEKEDAYVCYFKLNEPTIICLGELVTDPKGIVVILSTPNNALINAINHVKNNLNLKD